MDLDSECLDVVGSICSAGEVGQVELDLVPALVESHRHRTDERFHTSCGLIVRCAESSSDIFIIKYHHFECKIFSQILDDHYKEGQLDTKSFLRISGTLDERGTNVGSHNFEN